MPNQRKAGTASHQFWCEDELWAAGLETAGRVGTNVSKVLRDALVAFVDSNALESPPVPAGPLALLDAGVCPGCEVRVIPAPGSTPPNASELVWAHMETCPGLVALARQAGII